MLVKSMQYKYNKNTPTIFMQRYRYFRLTSIANIDIIYYIVCNIFVVIFVLCQI